MELNFSELDNNSQLTDTSNINPQHDKYWNTPQKENTPFKKKKVSFDDILTNMNLVVNQNGALQFMTPIKKNVDINPSSIIQKQEPLEPGIKHSYIYNKYFKDYKDTNKEIKPVRVIKTKEEYNRMILEERMKAFYHKKRIEEIKSKKLMFTNSFNDVNIISSTKTQLRNMNFY